jgi:halimadienyl-diphosphate synthase
MSRATRATTKTATRARVDLRQRLPALLHDLLEEVAADQDERMGGGNITPSAYEAAWVAMVRDPRHEDRLAFPASLLWLLQAQRPDGSWDPAFPHSLLPTMAALLALRRASQADEATQRAAASAERYLRRALGQWRGDAFDTPFFEFLIPQLASELAHEGVPLPVPNLALMERRRAQKLARLPLELLYTGQSNLLHALEAFGPLLDYQRLRPLRAPNGGYGYSPSATAAALLYGAEWDEEAARWLRALSARGFGGVCGAMPTSHPADVFEAAWVLHLLLHGGVALDPAASPPLQQLLRWLSCSLAPDGASFARMRALPGDADDTAVALAVLNRLGVQTPLDPLWTFEREDHFVSYAGERTASISANAHALEAILSVDAIGLLPALAARQEKLIHYLLRERTDEGFWVDKWHLSPYYATLKAALALTRAPDPALRHHLLPTLTWLCQSQQRGGGWGMRRPTVEETAYAVLTLRGLRRALGPESAASDGVGALRRGRAYLLRRLAELDRPLPTLWVDKTLYAPPRVIRAAALAALHT